MLSISGPAIGLMSLMVMVGATTSYLSPCEDYLLEREIKPAPLVIHAHDSPQYNRMIQAALENPNINSKVKVKYVTEFLSQSVRGYHYYANFTGSINDKKDGYCFFEWVMVPYVPEMPMAITHVDCTFY